MDTSAIILAVASPPGRSLRGIVRISGAQTFELIEGCLGRSEASPSRGVHRARFRFKALHLPCLVLVFPAPGSYTGEDAVELQLPGNPVLLERVIDALVESGRSRGLDARRAEAGEFTARAFLNGKMSLTQAEGVAAIIAAQSDAQLRAGRLLASGALGDLARELADDLAAALALVEAGIDFTDQEDVVAIGPGELRRRVVALRDRIQDQLDRSVGTEQLEALAWVVLTGEPNSGKSTLFNALLGRTRAVVSETAGTTRDVLAEPLSIDTTHGPAEVMLVDLAGADADASDLNRQMQAAARQAVDRADLILHCVPADETAPDIADGDRLVVRTKSDLGSGPGSAEGLAVSARTGDGLDALRAAIAQRLADRAVSLAADAMALRPRHEAALRFAARNLAEAIALVEPARGERHLPQPELAAATLRAALDELGGLAGDITPDDVLGRVFATFCVGK
ncbi:MAG: tRNA modification GTPase [Planctomycetota bacterium]|jgi:tRNA modification GTPase